MQKKKKKQDDVLTDVCPQFYGINLFLLLRPILKEKVKE